MARSSSRGRRVAGVAKAVGGVEFVSTAAITAATTLVVTGMAAGYDYIITLEAFAPTDDGQVLWMRWSDDAGVSYEAGSADYQWQAMYGATVVQDVSDAQIDVSGVTCGNDANNTSTIEVTMPNPNASGEQTTAFWSGYVMDTQATPETPPVSGAARFIQGTDEVDAVQFLWSGGSTFKAQGDITVWRRRRS